MSNHNSLIYFAETQTKGRGVFATQHIPAGQLIEICPVVVLPGSEKDYLQESELYNYYFIWGEEDEAFAIALGFGSVYNHSYTPNAFYEADYQKNILIFRTLVNIEADTEITVNYNQDPTNQDPLWFDVK